MTNKKKNLSGCYFLLDCYRKSVKIKMNSDYRHNAVNSADDMKSRLNGNIF